MPLNVQTFIAADSPSANMFGTLMIHYFSQQLRATKHDIRLGQGTLALAGVGSLAGLVDLVRSPTLTGKLMYCGSVALVGVLGHMGRNLANSAAKEAATLRHQLAILQPAEKATESSITPA